MLREVEKNVPDDLGLCACGSDQGSRRAAPDVLPEAFLPLQPCSPREVMGDVKLPSPCAEGLFVASS